MRCIVVALLLLGSADASLARLPQAAASTAEPARLSIAGRVAHPRIFTLAELERVAPTTVAMPVQHGSGQATYTGALLWTLLDSAGLVDEPGPKTYLRHTFVARGSDGYAVALAVGELDPKFEGKTVIVAYAQDGKPIAGLKLIIPNDRRAGREVRDLVSIDVR